MKKILIVLFGAILIAGCSQKQQKAPADDATTDEVSADSSSVSAAYDSLVVSESRAMVDSTYRESEEYQNSHETYTKMMNQMAGGVSDAERMLMELDLAIKAMNENGKYFATHSQEMRDPVNRNRMAVYGKKIKELRNQLLNMDMDDAKRERFDSLNSLVKF